MRKTAVFLAASLPAGCASFDATPGVMGNPTWGGACYPDMKLDIQHMVPAPIADCGYVSSDASPGLQEKVKSCAKRAAQGVQPFVFGFQDMGTELWSCNAAVRGVDGRLWYIYLTNDVVNGHSKNPGHTRWSISHCESLEFSDDGNPSSIFFGMRGCAMDTDEMERLRSLRPHPHGIVDPP